MLCLVKSLCILCLVESPGSITASSSSKLTLQTGSGFAVAAGWLPLTRPPISFVLSKDSQFVACALARGIPPTQLVHESIEADLMGIAERLWNAKGPVVNAFNQLGGMESAFMRLKEDTMRFLPGMDRVIEQVKNEKIVFSAVCKNTASSIGTLRRNLEDTGRRFGDYRVIIYENNSGDGTGALIKQWAAQNPKVSEGERGQGMK